MSRIIIEKVDKLPEYIKNNSEDYWDYPIEELDHILEMVDDGSFDNETVFLLYNNRLYES